MKHFKKLSKNNIYNIKLKRFIAAPDCEISNHFLKELIYIKKLFI